MKSFMTFTFAAVATIGIAATAWSQGGQAGGGGTVGAAGASGTAGAAGPSGTAGTAGAAGTAGTAGKTGTAGTAGAAGTTGPAGTSGTAGNATIGAGTGARSGVGNNNAAGRATIGQNRLRANANANANLNTGITPNPFFADPGVRQQLNLNDTQFNSLNRAYLDSYNRFNQNVTGLNANLTPEQRMARMQQLENQFNTDFSRSADTTFNDPRFRTRFDQLNRQYMFFNAFNDRALQRQLSLTPQQMQQVQQLAAQWRQQLMQLNSNNGVGVSGIDPQEWNQIYTQYWNQLNGVLTPEQQQTWMQLTGQRYTFPSNLYVPTTRPRGANRVPTAPNQVPPGTTEPRYVPLGGTTSGTGNAANKGQTTPQGNSANAGNQGGTVR
jgi:hypothetical protein